MVRSHSLVPAPALAPALALALAFALAAAGCVQVPGGALKPGNAPMVQAAGGLAFSTKIIDSVRAGGEPVIQVTQKGTLLVAAHPGWTHTRYPPSANLVTPASGQSYMWRSTDNGSTWTPLGLPMANGAGPRGLGQGVSDPDFAMDSKGRIYFTDLEALVSASVSWSDDDGATWLLGNDIAASFGGAPIDRNWLATHGTDVYFMGNYFTGGENVLKSSDGGITWSKVGSAHCGGDLTTRASDGAILVGCGDAIDVSTDGGAHFEKRAVSAAGGRGGGSMSEPAVDAAGNVFTAWSSAQGVLVAGTRDLGATWTTPLQLQPLGNDRTPGTNIFPWVVAGDAGRVAVAWFHSEGPNATSKPDSKWFVELAIVTDAMSTAPQIAQARVTDQPIHTGYVCVGTVCQADPGSTGDRRLGDFFEATIDAQGRVLMSYAVTSGADSISHPGFARQTSGPLLR